MIDWKLQVVVSIGMLFYFFVLIYFLKKKQLTTKYALLWIFAGVVMFVMVLFPQILTFFAGIFGFDVPANMLFAVIFFCIIVLLIFLTSVATKLNDRVTKLTQSVALLEKRVRELEQQTASDKKEEETV